MVKKKSCVEIPPDRQQPQKVLVYGTVKQSFSCNQPPFSVGKFWEPSAQLWFHRATTLNILLQKQWFLLPVFFSGW